MTPRLIIIVFIIVFAFFTAIIKQVYDNQTQPKTFKESIVEILLSGVSGVIVAFIMAEKIQNELTLIALGGLGGLLGLSGVKAMLKIKSNTQDSFKLPKIKTIYKSKDKIIEINIGDEQENEEENEEEDLSLDFLSEDDD